MCKRKSRAESILIKDPGNDRNTTREILSSYTTRPEGVRVKHSINRNSIKMYEDVETPPEEIKRQAAKITRLLRLL